MAQTPPTLKQRIRSVSLIFACGTALFSDGYSNGVISAVLNRIYGADRIENHNYGTIVRSLTFAGTVVGMIIFGWLSDKVGRKFGMMSATGIVALFAGLSAASSGAHGSLGGMLAMLSAMRKDSMKNARIPYLLILKRYWVSLLAISFTWFLYDFIVYPFGLYSSIIIDRRLLMEIGSITGGSDSLTVVLGWNTVIKLSCKLSIGTLIGAFILDYLGPKYTMITGLVLQAIVGFIMSGLYEKLANHIAGFAVVYGIFLSFGEVGPGNCLGLLASKSSPTAVRGQFYGAAAAVGKVGAFVGTWAFPPMISAFGGPDTTKGNTGPFWVGSGLAILSAIIVILFIRPLTHDGMVEEDAAFRRYLEEHGYDTSSMGLVESTTSTTVETDEKLGSFEKV
ncbi:hypothetical protein AN958_07165 [Leucoagaricus sp. SymC.cos]|nr:hypothetical protein AN958_07165 [Leucoagaricus sp. SymC.cos]